ncbi:UDP-2,4-diacetamido-2,4,6-trideoxy-beta-L-altropyranose hydrolase [Lutibacter oricola]|uniref:UDP-2,4-diacetamido-2,4,6-trideoxy-beta-L-altropyranose hydrolase n=1 Tax=Lutibacter oricola TaxID=762486 RepID=A0A1H2TPA0_9FLAO|nr:UDP-2,4-diacetamido-2,4,6-trideoxy-beta-L-altropyranose hydrolase [Lutibacter oricola]SDW45597.1 UDP-2,4-diacetamido-2,4,6-trideoxy-beta-L-altropyranose hydrolase [Lutibacter oricola]
MLKKNKILFRADGNSEIGLGHLYRLLAVAEMCKDYFDFVFLTKSDSFLDVIPKNFRLKTIPENITINEEPKWLSNNYKAKNYLIIADGYQFVSTYQKLLKKHGYLLVYIDDLTSEHMFADVVVNHSPGLTKSNFKGEFYTKYALGINYAMLRPKFLAESLVYREITKIDKAFVCFGGADYLDLSLKATKALLEISQVTEIHVILGGAYKSSEIFKLAKDYPEINLYQNLGEAELFQIMKQCNFAIAPASTILYELCSIKIPVLSGFFVDNQRHIYNYFSSKKVVFSGGNFSTYTVEIFKSKIQSIILNKNYKTFIDKQQQLFNGESQINFLNLINNLFLTIRNIKKQDIHFLYELSNDMLVRNNSFNSDIILFENHKKWFNSKLNDENVLMYIGEYNSKPFGVVRYEKYVDYSIIGISISKEFRGEKLASLLLNKAINAYFRINKKPILAYIKEANVASIKSFEKSGFTFLKKENVNGSLSNVYKLEK